MRFYIDAKIFFHAVFMGYEFWRIRFQDGAISKLMSAKTALSKMFFNPGSSAFIDYSYSERFFK